jgi:hypothetical protein
VLVVAGGPARADIEVSINGQFAMTVQEDPPLFTEIADLLKPGLNTLEMELKAPDRPREGTRHVEIEVSRTETRGARTSTFEHPLAQIVVPADIGP